MDCKDAERYLCKQLGSLDARTYVAAHKLSVASYLTRHWLPAMHARGLRPPRWTATKAT